MKLTLFFLITSVLGLFATESYSQNTRITLDLKSVTVKEALKAIENTSEFFFIYNNELINVEREIDLNVKDQKITEVLNNIFEGRDVEITVIDRKIVLAPTFMGEQQPTKKITGKVTDQSGASLPGVSVAVKGTTIGVITDPNGTYSILNIPENATLLFSFVGMKMQEIVVENKTTINVVLEEETVGIGEVVAIGYGTQTKREISGSVTNVTAKDFNKGVVANAADLLQGKVAGLNITKGSGDVTNGSTIRLRGTSSLTGSSSPFVVIDGVPGGDLDAVAPQNIESISILKDASSAAIYGSRSASGVILITTKKGVKGNTKVNYDAYVGIDQVTNKPKLLNGAEWRKYAADNNKNISGMDLGADTDWFGEIMRTGVTQNHSLSFSGGSDDHNYMASASYLDVQGVVKGNSMNRFNFRFSFNQFALNKKLLLSFTGNAVIGDNSPTDNYNFILAYNTIPVVPVKLTNGQWYDNTDFDQGNPVRNIELNRRDNKENKLYANVKADFEIIKGLNFTASGFRERNTNDWGLYNNSTTASGRNSIGYAQRQSNLWDRSLFETTLRYKKSFNDIHNITALAGYSWEQNDWRYFGAQNQQFGTDLLGYDNLQAGENLKPTDVYSQRNMSRLISSFARFTYNYNEKYVFAATVRRDGSSKFGANNKWGTFPSFSAAWNITKEGFMSNISAVNDLKFRVGYGITGNQDGIGPYNSINLYGEKGKYWNDGQWYTSYGVTQNPNPNLKWEKTSMFNIGLDFAILNNRVNGTVEWYNKETSDLLYTYNVPVPPYQYNTILANVGGM
ncbi:MAG: SusC/RagA family TonB-linked outer membrane protein [Bacteroidota bacterium]